MRGRNPKQKGSYQKKKNSVGEAAVFRRIQIASGKDHVVMATERSGIGGRVETDQIDLVGLEMEVCNGRPTQAHDMETGVINKRG